jgi:hypothetical protein
MSTWYNVCRDKQLALRSNWHGATIPALTHISSRHATYITHGTVLQFPAFAHFKSMRLCCETNNVKGRKPMMETGFHRVLWFSRRWTCRIQSPGMWRCMITVTTDDSEEHKPPSSRLKDQWTRNNVSSNLQLKNAAKHWLYEKGETRYGVKERQGVWRWRFGMCCVWDVANVPSSLILTN